MSKEKKKQTRSLAFANRFDVRRSSKGGFKKAQTLAEKTAGFPAVAIRG